jgi:putative aldouronate transport system substrate-binding protein
VAAGLKPEGTNWACYKTWYGPTSGFGVLNGYFEGDNFLISKLVGYQTPTMVNQWTSLQQLETQSFTEFISGIKPVEDFDKFVDDWNSMGGELIGYEVNNWYKEKGGN